MSDIPKSGDRLTFSDVEMISEAVKTRQKNFPNESIDLTVALVLTNIGKRFAPVTCIDGEWTGFISDVPKLKDDSDTPTCPNGHDLGIGPSLVLGWYTEE
jgi:hypothetical protein